MSTADGASPERSMVLAGIVRTSKGFAVAVAELAADGTTTSLRIGRSQTIREFVALEHKKMLAPMAMKV
jgi:hypothetical protein